jgi:hypothetical protein
LVHAISAWVRHAGANCRVAIVAVSAAADHGERAVRVYVAQVGSVAVLVYAIIGQLGGTWETCAVLVVAVRAGVRAAITDAEAVHVGIFARIARISRTVSVGIRLVSVAYGRAVVCGQDFASVLSQVSNAVAVSVVAHVAGVSEAVIIGVYLV